MAVAFWPYVVMRYKSQIKNNVYVTTRQSSLSVCPGSSVGERPPYKWEVKGSIPFRGTWSLHGIILTVINEIPVVV